MTRQTPSGILFGLILALLAEFAVSFGNVQIKYSHKLDVMSYSHTPVYKRLRWWFGFLMYVFNAIFKFSSYMFASLNIIAPISSLCIIMNIFLANYYFKEKLTKKGIIGSTLIIIGCILCVALGSHEIDKLTIKSLFKYAKTNIFIIFTTFHISLCILFGIIGLYLVLTSQHIIDDMIDNRVQSEEENKNNNNDNNDDDTNDINIDEQRCLINEQNGDDNNNMNIIDNITSKITSKVITFCILQTTEQKHEFVHVLTCFFLSFTTAGVCAWVQMIGKIGADLLWQTLFMNNNQFTSIIPFIIIIILAVLLCMELYFVSEIMRLFDAILVVPIFNCLLILTTIGVSAAYFHNFAVFTTVKLVFFIFGLLFIIFGMILLMKGQKHSSMKHRKIDRELTKNSLITNTN